MSSVNKVIIVGHLGVDPERRYTQSGTPYVRLSVATSHIWKDKEGERREETTWHHVSVWGKFAEHCTEYLRKGRQVCVEGRIRRYKYRDKNEQERWGSEIHADRVVFLSSGRSGDASAPRAFVSDTVPPPRLDTAAPAPRPSADPHDDIPF